MYRQKSKSKKSLGLPTKPQKILDQKFTPKKIPCQFSRLKAFQKGLNATTGKQNIRNWMFVFVYLSYHLNLSFPDLIVIGCTLFAELGGRDTWALPRILYCLEYPPKSLLESSDPKSKCCVNCIVTKMCLMKVGRWSSKAEYMQQFDRI